MPPTGGHYRSNNNLSNPYNQYPQQHQQFQPQSNYNSQNFGSHGTFGTALQNQQGSIFGGGLPSSAQSAGFGTAALQGAGGTGLASQEAQMRFAHGAALQRQHEGVGASRNTGVSTRIREVWANNMEQEFATIRSLVDKYPYISMVRCHNP